MTEVAKVLTDNIKHHMGANCYIREAIIPAGYSVVKHVHGYDHFSILASGMVFVLVDGLRVRHTAPTCIKIAAGVEHEIVALVDSTWFCIHGGTEEIDDMESVIVAEKGVE